MEAKQAEVGSNVDGIEVFDSLRTLLSNSGKFNLNEIMLNIEKSGDENFVKFCVGLKKRVFLWRCLSC